MTAGLDGGATAAALGVSAGVTYDGALTLLSGKRKGAPGHVELSTLACHIRKILVKPSPSIVQLSFRPPSCRPG
jgi:hypothetical protein